MKLEITTDPDASALETVKRGMRAYEVSRLPGLPAESEDIRVAAFARDEVGAVCGGLLANVYWDGLEIEILWVAESHRGRKLGRRLVGEIEAFARRQGAVIAFLKTVDARGFYERLGYRVFGTLEDRPIGTVLYHMKKRLDGTADRR